MTGRPADPPAPEGDGPEAPEGQAGAPEPDAGAPEPDRGTPEPGAAAPDARAGEPDPASRPLPHEPPRPGLTTFTIEGRSAPALFVVGWVATLLGLGCVLAAVLAGNAPVVLIVGLALLSLGLVSGAGSQAIERRARGTGPWLGPSPLLVFAATIPLAFLATLLVAGLLSALNVEAPRAATDLLIVAIQGAVNVGLVALLVVGTGALSWRAMGLHRDLRRAVGDLAWGAVLAGPIVALTLVLTTILVLIFGVAPDSPLAPTGEPGGLILHLLAAAVIAPLSEEILFRGVATTAWVRTYGVRSGILRAAVFFALAHVLLLGGSTVQEALAAAIVGFAGRLPVAVALGWVYVRRDSLWAPIGLHAAFNAALLILADAASRVGGGA